MENKTVGKKLIKIIKIAFIVIGVLTAIFVSFVYYFGSKEESKTYGNSKIEYYSPDFTDAELDKVANALTKIGLFGTPKSITVYLEREGTTYTIQISTISTDIDNAKYQAFRDLLQSYLPENKVIFALSYKDSNTIFKEYK